MNTNPGALSAAEARALFRAGTVAPTAGWAVGYTQANLVSVPTDIAYDLLLFAQRNPKPCPVLDVTEPGAATTVLAPDADLRTRRATGCGGTESWSTSPVTSSRPGAPTS
jgi:uncharacterized protein YcsI (UPF0317 family)